MKKQKWLKKTAAMLLAGTMLCGTAVWTGAGFTETVKAAAVTLPEIQDTTKGSLKITKKDGSGKVLGGAGFTLYKVMDLNKQPDKTYKFTPRKEFFGDSGISADDLGNYSAEEIEKMATDLAAKVKTGNIIATKPEQTTESGTGITTFTELDLGYYLVVETKVPESYIAGKPFLVAIPFTNASGTEWVYDAEAVPKNYSTAIGKEINKDDTLKGDNVSQDGSVKVGDYVPYKITTRTPNYADELYKKEIVQFTITDVMSKGLKIIKDESHPITVKIKEDSGNFKTLTENTEYTAQITPDAAEGQPDLTVEFKSEYLKSQDASNKDVEITYYAQVTADAVTGTVGNTNQPTLKYTNQPGEKPGTVPGPEVKVYTFDIKVMKFTKEGENKALPGAKFQLYKTAVEDGNKIGGIVETAGDGTISFKQLDEGIYYLKETEAPDGYTLLANPIKIEIVAAKDSSGNADGKFTLKINDKLINDGTGIYVSHKEENNGLSYVAVENHKGFNIPMTGGMGIALFLAVGAAGIVIVSVLLVKKSKEAK